MTLATLLANRVYNSVRFMLRNGWDDGRINAWIREHHNEQFNAAAALIARTRQAMIAGDIIGQSPGGAVPGVTFAVNPQIRAYVDPGLRGRVYAYQVVLTYRSPYGATEHGITVTIGSTRELTPDEIRRDAEALALTLIEDNRERYGIRSSAGNARFTGFFPQLAFTSS